MLFKTSLRIFLKETGTSGKPLLFIPEPLSHFSLSTRNSEIEPLVEYEIGFHDPI